MTEIEKARQNFLDGLDISSRCKSITYCLIQKLTSEMFSSEIEERFRKAEKCSRDYTGMWLLDKYHDPDPRVRSIIISMEDWLYKFQQSLGAKLDLDQQKQYNLTVNSPYEDIFLAYSVIHANKIREYFQTLSLLPDKLCDNVLIVARKKHIISRFSTHLGIKALRLNTPKSFVLSKEHFVDYNNREPELEKLYDLTQSFFRGELSEDAMDDILKNKIGYKSEQNCGLFT